MSGELAMMAYEAYRKMAGGPSFHQLTPEQRVAWSDVAETVMDQVDDHCEGCMATDCEGLK